MDGGTHLIRKAVKKMSDYISREIAKEKIGNLDGFGVIGRCLDEIPSVDVIPIEWLKNYAYSNRNSVVGFRDFEAISRAIEEWRKENE